MNAYSDALKRRKTLAHHHSLMEGSAAEERGESPMEESKEDAMHDLAPTVKDGLPSLMEAGDAGKFRPTGNAHDDAKSDESDGPSLAILMGHDPSEHDMSSLKENRKPKSLLEAAKMALAKKVK